MNRKDDNNHLRISSGLLRKDILDEIVEKSALTRCPYCGGGLKSSQCSLCGSLVLKFDSDIQRIWKECGQCQVFWILKLENWENERGDGMVAGSGRKLSLEGETNCYCRRNVFEGADWVTLTNYHKSEFLFAGDENERQKIMTYTYAFDLETMGRIVPMTETSKRVILFDGFIKEKLPINVFLIGKPSNVMCPFCKKGRLVLREVKPKYSSGGMFFSSPLEHVGDDFKYGCSQKDCGAEFEGSFQWMWID